jgi:MFS family permease
MTSLALGSMAPARRAFALFIVLAAQCMFSMDLLVVVVALPRIQQDLGFTPANLTWVLNAFGLAFGGLLLLGGRLGDMVGQVRAFRGGLFVFVLASLLGGIAPTPGVLVAARVLQGMGAGPFKICECFSWRANQASCDRAVGGWAAGEPQRRGHGHA